MGQRLSGWQNFAKNYKSTKEVFDDLFSAVETKKIMDEEVVTGYSNESGIGPHRGDQQWSYGGKTYDKEITPQMLTGLKNARLADVMTRFGDREGAMKMQLDQATLRGLDDQHALDSGTLAENIKKIKIENDAKVATMNLTIAQIKEYQALTPLKAQEYIAKIANQRQITGENIKGQADRLEILSDKADTSRVVFDEFTSDLATDNRERGLGLTKAEQLNEEKRKENEKKKIELEGKILDSTYDNELATALFNSGTAKNESEAAEMASKLSLQGNETLTEFATKMANKEFKSAEEQKKWLLDAWDDTHDPRIRDMISGIDAMELSQITAEGTKTMAEINNALSGKGSNAAKAALIKVIDMQDGIQGNMKFDKDDKGNTVLLEDGKVVVAGHKAGWTAFTESLYAEFTPLKSLEIAKSNADIRYVNAQAAFKESEAGMKVTIAESKAWGDHTQTELFRQLATMSEEEFKKATGFPTMDEYAKDYIARMRTATGVTDYTGWSSTETTPK